VKQKKVCMLGAAAVGKTSLVARYVRSIFSEKYHSTIGVKIDKKTVRYGDDAVNLILWDIYGEDQFQQVQTSYLRGASGYLLVADGTRPDTLDTALVLHERVYNSVGALPFRLLINKSDLAERWALSEAALVPLREQGWQIIRTSAKTGEGVEQAFISLTEEMLS
jgi:small GTP-binding protein